MKEFKVNRNGWLYKWLAFYKLSANYDDVPGWMTLDERYWNQYLIPGDFCQFLRAAFVWPLMRIGLNLGMYFVAFSMLYFVEAEVGGYEMLRQLGMVILVLAVAAGFVGIVILLFRNFLKLLKRLFNLRLDHMSTNSNGFISTSYDAFKNKYCPTIEYEKEPK